MRTEEEVREKLKNAEMKLRAFEGDTPIVNLFGKPPDWFLEQIRDQISLFKWYLNEEE